MSFYNLAYKLNIVHYFIWYYLCSSNVMKCQNYNFITHKVILQIYISQ